MSVKLQNRNAKPSTPEPGTEASPNARIAARYDQAPYASHAYPQSQPARLAAIAQLYGLDAPAIETARVLEIGCASGGNIIPLAARYPEAHFTGVELSIVQAEQGAVRIARLGLGNAAIVRADVAAFAPGEKAFDYILCHGVYSWAPQAVRDAILRVIGECLSPEGVAFVSYNVLPGWRPKQVLRDALMSRVSGIADVGAQVAFTRAFLARLRDWKGGDTAYHRDLKEMAAHAEAIRDDYLAHEFLENDNEPQTFTQFAQEAARAELAFLGESEMWMQIAENFDLPTRDILRDLSGNLVLPMEQSIDILTGRTFRQTLLVHGARAEKIERILNPKRLEGLHILGPVAELAEPRPGHSWSFVGAGQRTLSTSGAPARRAFQALAAQGPSSLPFAAMVEAGALGEEERALTIDAIYKAVVAGVVNVVSAPVVAQAVAGDLPLAPGWVRSDVGAGEVHVANLRHESVTLEIVPRLLMPLLDGKHGRASLEAELLARAKAGDVKFHRGGAEVADDEGLAACAKEHVERTLAQLGAVALLG